jgi:hypothetical protein
MRKTLSLLLFMTACATGGSDAELDTLRQNLVAAKDLPSQIDAHARLGQALWKRACAHVAHDGTCTSHSEPEPVVKGVQTRCGPATKNLRTFIARDAALSAQAHDELTKAMQLWNNGEALKSLDSITDENDRTAKAYVMVGAAAGAQLALADADFEAFLAIRLDKNLAFDTPEHQQESRKVFMEWFDKKDSAFKQATTTYQALAESEPIQKYSGDRAIAAIARHGQMFQHYADTLWTLHIPEELRKDQDAVDQYCDALGQKAQPLEDSAVEAYRACVVKARDLKVTGDWPELCRHEFSQLHPQEEP